MPIMNFNLEDGKPPVSFNINGEGAERMMAFMDECTKSLHKAREIRNQALEDAAVRIEDEVCGCCVPEGVQEFATEVVESIRAMKEG